MRKAFLPLVILLAVSLLAACQTQQPQTVEKVVTTVVEKAVTTVVEVEKQVTTVVEKEVTTVIEGEEVVITATPEPAAGLTSKDPETLVALSFADAESLDPALDYETGGGEIIQNVYETLIFYDKANPSEFVPQLATEWEVSEDGTEYTFTIREGVTFHDGAELDPEDVEYSIERGLLQGGTSSPQWLFVEPILGAGLHDVTELVDPEGTITDDPAAVQAADPAALEEACQRVTEANTVDGNQVTFTLAQARAPFIPTLAGFWGSVLDKDWAIENGAWDGDCATWQNFYGVTAENDPLNAIMNGTGPYILESWNPGEEMVLVANENYWRNEETGPAWEGGPVGPPAIKRVVLPIVEEWGTRFAMLQAGDADFFTPNRENYPQIDPLVGETCTQNDEGNLECEPTENPNGPLRRVTGLLNPTRSDGMFTWEVNTEGGNNFIGSGQLDGNGIPPNFFSDINVRRGFNYCFDWDTFIQEVYQGEAVQNVGMLIPGMIGYNEEGPKYEYNPELAAEELAQAWEGQLPELGFRMQVGYNTGNTTRETMLAILQACLSEVSENYVLEAVGLPWPNYLAQQRAGNLPFFVTGWIEDLHDPHNWVQPHTVGTYGGRANLPEDVMAQFEELMNAGIATTDEEERAEIYQQIDQLDYDLALAIRGVTALARAYHPRYIQGYYSNPIYSGLYFYALSKE